jgi:putative heme-binding domain-containing protein
MEVVENGIEGRGMPAFWFLGEAPSAQVAAYVESLARQTGQDSQTTAGNAERGKALFASKGCSGCHIVAGEGSAYGPDLSSIGSLRSAAVLRQSILDPAASIPNGFAMVRVSTREGITVSGIRMNEDSFTIQVRDAGGRFYSFRKQDVAEIRKEFDKSPMPSYKGALTDGELDDLVAWLSTLRQLR